MKKAAVSLLMLFAILMSSCAPAVTATSAVDLQPTSTHTGRPPQRKSTATATATITPTPMPASVPTPTPTPNPYAAYRRDAPLTGELWYSRSPNLPIPYIVGQADFVNKYQEEAAREALKILLETPAVQNMIQSTANSDVMCAYQKAWDHRGSQVELQATDLPNHFIYTMSKAGATVAYANNAFIRMGGVPGDQSGWQVYSEKSPYPNATAVNIIFDLGYNAQFKQREYVEWLQLCSNGVYKLVYDPNYVISPDFLQDPDVADVLDINAVVALIMAIDYDLERAQVGENQVREMYYHPNLIPPLWNNVHAGNIEITRNTWEAYLFDTWETVEWPDGTKEDPTVVYTNLSDSPISPDKYNTWREFFAAAQYRGLINTRPYMEVENPKASEGMDYYGIYHDSRYKLNDTLNWFDFAFSSDEVSHYFLATVDNKPLWRSVALPAKYTDGLNSTFAVPVAYLGSASFVGRMMFDYGHQLSDEQLMSDNNTTFHDLMFGKSTVNFTGNDRPASFADGTDTPWFDDQLKNYGTMAANPYALDDFVRELEGKYQKISGAYENDNNGKYYHTSDVSKYNQAVAPLLPALIVRQKPDGALFHGTWKEVSSSPFITTYITGDQAYDRILLYSDMPVYWAMANTFMLGGGLPKSDISSPANPPNIAGGRYNYGGPAFINLLGDVVVEGNHRIRFPFTNFGGTYSNPSTGKYMLDSGKIGMMSKDREFGYLTVCSTASNNILNVPNQGFNYVMESDCASLYDKKFEHKGEEEAVVVAENMQIMQGLGDMVLQSMVMLGTDDLQLVDNPEVLDNAMFKPQWLKDAINENKQRWGDKYDEHKPFFGIYTLPTYYQPVYPLPVSPLCQFDVNCMVMSTMYGVGGTAEKPVNKSHLMSFPVVSGYFAWENEFNNDLHYYHGSGVSPIRSEVSYAGDRRELWNDLMFNNFYGYDVDDKGPDYAETDYDGYVITDYNTKAFEEIMNIFNGNDEFIKSGENPYTLVMDPVAFDKAYPPYDLTYNHDGFLKFLSAVPFATLSMWVRPNVQRVMATDAPTTSWGDKNFIAAQDVSNMWYTGYRIKRKNAFVNRFDDSKDLFFLSTKPYYVMPDQRELMALADSLGLNLPYPHIERSPGSMKVKALYDYGEQVSWTFPAYKKDFSIMEHYAKDIWRVQILESYVPDGNYDEHMSNLCEYNPFMVAKKELGDKYAERMWELAYRWNVGDPHAEVPPLSCDNNSFNMAPVDFHYYPVLAQILHDGNYGGLPDYAKNINMFNIWRYQMPFLQRK